MSFPMLFKVFKNYEIPICEKFLYVFKVFENYEIPICEIPIKNLWILKTVNSYRKFMDFKNSEFLLKIYGFWKQ